MMFFRTFKPALILLLALTVLLGIIYPLFIFGIGQTLFPHKANGSLYYYKDGKVLGSELIGQNFTSNEYFHPRPSYAGTGYDATNSSGSNFGPTSQKLHDALATRSQNYRKTNKLDENTKIPADAVTSSASGLDPHISVDNALLQASRIASARKRPVEEIRSIIKQNTIPRSFWVMGEPRVNVLKVNLALDELSATKQ